MKYDKIEVIGEKAKVFRERGVDPGIKYIYCAFKNKKETGDQILHEAYYSDNFGDIITYLLETFEKGFINNNTRIEIDGTSDSEKKAIKGLVGLIKYHVVTKETLKQLLERFAKVADLLKE